MSNTKKFNTDLPSMQCKRFGCAAAALGKQIFVVGGINDEGQTLRSGEIFHIETNQWTTLNNSMSTARRMCAAVSLEDSVIVMGGRDESWNYLSSVEEYNTRTQQWASLPSMTSKRWGCAASVLDGKIIVIGGYGGGNSLASAEEYNPTTKEWIMISPMNVRRYGCAAAVLGGQLYVVGGYNYDGGKSNNLSSAEVYNPATKRWSLIAGMSTPRYGCAAASVGRKIIVVGGHDGRNYLSSCEAYDTTTRQWSNIESMHNKRYGCAAVEIEGTIYVMGGSDGSNRLSSMESLQIQPRPRASEFYTKLFEHDERNVNCKIEELVNSIDDVHKMKLFYTLVNHSYRTGSVTQEDRKRNITSSLKKVASSTTCYDSIAIFKQLLEKARQDAIITDHEYYTFDRMAEVTHTATAPFVNEIWESIQGLTTHVNTLENRVDLLDARVDNLDDRMRGLEIRTERLEKVSANLVDSLRMLQKGIRRKQKIEIRAGMMSAVLNAVSFGITGSVVMGKAINSIVDFGDISHIQTVVESVGNATVHEAFKTALDAISDTGEDAVYRAANKGRAKLQEPTVHELMAKADEGNPLFAIVVTAQIISQEYDDIPQEQPSFQSSAQMAAVSQVHQVPPTAFPRTMQLFQDKVPTAHFIQEPTVVPVEATRVVSAVTQTNIPISARLDALEEAAAIEKTSSAIRKRLEALEMSVFDDLQEGTTKERVSRLEEDLL